MTKTAEESAKEIRDFMDRCGGNYREWYVGVSEDPHMDLDQRHNFDTDAGDIGIISTCESEVQAAKVAQYFVKKYRCQGRYDDMAVDAVHVYAYKMAPHTIP